MLTRIHTRTHTHTTFADPWMACTQCRQRVKAWHNPQQCGCDQTVWQNLPCGHQAAAHSLCWSWSAVDGCTCILTHEFGAP